MTGSSGFAGRWLCRHLEACGDEVSDDSSIDEEAADRRGQRLRAQIVASEPDVLFHLASTESVRDSWKDPEATFETNATGTLRVLDAALACDQPPRTVLLSSFEVYGQVSPDSLPVTEDAPLAPVSPFAVSKVAAEFLGKQALLGTRLPVVVARLFNSIGPDQSSDSVSGALAQRIARALKSDATSLVAGNLDVVRDYVDIRDAARALRLLGEKGKPGEAYNICGGRSVSVRELATKLMDLAKIDLDLEVDPRLLRPREILEMRGSADKLHAVTGWAPEIKLEQSLADVLRHWKQVVAQAGQ